MGFEAETDAGFSSSTSMAPCDDWFLAYTRPQLEGMARHNLEQQGFQAYLPLYKNFKNKDGERVIAFEPMFPRYVFFRPVRPAQSIAPVHSTRGVARVVRFGHEIARIRSDTLNVIRELESERNAVDEAGLSPLRPGHVVRFRDPAFCGLEGLVKTVSSRRVAVLLELMGRQQVVNVQHHQLEAA
jgi:transcriptional antiterminator RfaH